MIATSSQLQWGTSVTASHACHGPRLYKHVIQSSVLCLTYYVLRLTFALTHSAVLHALVVHVESGFLMDMPHCTLLLSLRCLDDVVFHGLIVSLATSVLQPLAMDMPCWTFCYQVASVCLRAICGGLVVLDWFCFRVASVPRPLASV